MNFAKIKYLSILLFISIFFINSANAQKYPFSVHDMLAMDRIAEYQVSPDEQWIVFTLRKTDLEANKGRTDLWLIETDGKNLMQLTTHPDADFNPFWSGDSKTIFFISTRSGSAQIWKIRTDGGEAQQVTNEPLDVGNLIMSPDDKYLAFTMDVFPRSTPSATKEKLDAIEERKSTGIIYENIFVRHWDTWKDGRRSHLFVMPSEGGKATDIMPILDADTPSKPFGGAEEFTFTPDSKSIIFTARNVGSKEAWSTDFDLYISPLVGTENPKCLTESNEAWDTSPVFSPDGKTLAYLAMEKPGYESDRFRIVLQQWPDGEKRVLTENWDRSPSSICFSQDGKTIFATAANLGQVSLFSIDTNSGNVETLVKDGTISSASVVGNKVIYAMNNLSSPTELFSVDQEGGNFKHVTNINKDKVAEASLGEYEQFTFKGWNDETVYCYVVKPANFDSSKNIRSHFLFTADRKVHSETCSIIVGIHRHTPEQDTPQLW